MKTWLFVLSVLVALAYLKWILLLLIYPFQAAFYRYRKTGKMRWRILGAPFWLWERLFRGGWQRYSLYQISLMPSVHLRRWLYMGLGAECGAHSVFHYRTEIRDPFLLKVGELLEEWTHKRSVDDLARTMSLGVDRVWLKTADSEVLVPINTVSAGDEIIVRTGRFCGAG